MIRDITSIQPAPRYGSVRESPAASGPLVGPTAAVAPVFNPRVRHDPVLDLVVLEFRTGSGEVRNSIPSARELEAYRRERTVASTTPDLDVMR